MLTEAIFRQTQRPQLFLCCCTWGGEQSPAKSLDDVKWKQQSHTTTHSLRANFKVRNSCSQLRDAKPVIGHGAVPSQWNIKCSYVCTNPPFHTKHTPVVAAATPAETTALATPKTELHKAAINVNNSQLQSVAMKCQKGTGCTCMAKPEQGKSECHKCHPWKLHKRLYYITDDLYRTVWGVMENILATIGETPQGPTRNSATKAGH